MRHGVVGLIVSAVVAGVADLAAQSAYPVAPRPLPDAAEIALATPRRPPRSPPGPMST